MTCGVYMISFGDRTYIGSAHNIKRRWAAHRSALRHRKHHSIFMQRLHDRGYAATFTVLEECDGTELLAVEQRYLDEHKPVLNTALIAGAPMLGRKHSPLSRVRLPKTEVQRKAVSVANKGRKHGPKGDSVRQAIRTSNPRKIGVYCVEAGRRFQSAGEASEWIFEQGLTTQRNMARSNINAARRVGGRAYGFTWLQEME